MQDEPRTEQPDAADTDAQSQAAQDAAPESAQDGAAATDPHAKIAQLQKDVEDLSTKAQEHWDRYLRATAEQDNIRKRAEREIEAARKFALEKFAVDLLGVRDSLEQGLKSFRDADVDNALVEGAELTLRIFTDAMHKHGVTVIDPLGEPFNPELHEAMAMVPKPDAQPNSVIEVVQKGYALHDRVLRPAMVIVAQG